MPLDFTGLSYETGQLYNANFFSPQNTALIAAFRGLSDHGVLRLGGHLSNITPWEGVGRDDLISWLDNWIEAASRELSSRSNEGEAKITVW